MNKLQKFLKLLDAKRKKNLVEVLGLIAILNLGQLDVKKMKGQKNTYRVRIGGIRIVFVKENGKGVPIAINTRGSAY